MAFEIAVEGNTVAQEVTNTIRAFVGYDACDLGIDDAGAGFDRIRCVLRRAVAFTDRSRNAALRPHARRAFTEWRRRNDGNGQRREFQRGEKPGKPSPDDDDVAWAGLTLERDEGSSLALILCSHRFASRGPSPENASWSD